MKTKIKLTEDQINILVESETKKLQAKFEAEVKKMEENYNKAVSSLRKKYEEAFVTVPDDETAEKPARGKFDEALFIKLWNEGKRLTDISKLMNLNNGYLSLKKKKLLEGKKIKERK